MRRVPLKARNARASRSGLPGRDDVMNYLEQSGGALSEHDLARAFGVKGRDRLRLKRMLRDLGEDGTRPTRRPAPGRRRASPCLRSPRSMPMASRSRASPPSPRTRRRASGSLPAVPVRRRRASAIGCSPDCSSRATRPRPRSSACCGASRGAWSACCSVARTVCSSSRPAMASVGCWCASRTASAPARAISWSPSGLPARCLGAGGRR